MVFQTVAAMIGWLLTFAAVANIANARSSNAMAPLTVVAAYPVPATALTLPVMPQAVPPPPACNVRSGVIEPASSSGNRWKAELSGARNIKPNSTGTAAAAGHLLRPVHARCMQLMLQHDIIPASVSPLHSTLVNCQMDSESITSKYLVGVTLARANSTRIQVVTRLPRNLDSG